LKGDDFQDFWVSRYGEPDVRSGCVHRIGEALPSQGFLALLEKEDTVLIGPSNPVTSIGPILALPGVRERLQDKKVVAMSPSCRNRPVSGRLPSSWKPEAFLPVDEGIATLLAISTFRGLTRRATIAANAAYENAYEDENGVLAVAIGLLDMIECS